MLSGAVIMIIRSHSARDGASRLTCRCLMEIARPETAAPARRAPGKGVRNHRPFGNQDFLPNGPWCFFPASRSRHRRWIGLRLPPTRDNGQQTRAFRTQASSRPEGGHE